MISFEGSVTEQNQMGFSVFAYLDSLVKVLYKDKAFSGWSVIWHVSGFEKVYGLKITCNIHLECYMIIPSFTAVHARVFELSWLNDQRPHGALWFDVKSRLLKEWHSVFKPGNLGCWLRDFTLKYNGAACFNKLVSRHLRKGWEPYGRSYYIF